MFSIKKRTALLPLVFVATIALLGVATRSQAASPIAAMLEQNATEFFSSAK